MDKAIDYTMQSRICRKAKRRKAFTPYVYVLPACIFMFVFVMIPIFLSLIMSLYKIPALGAEWKLTGFHNYTLAFAEKDFLSSLLRTLGFGAFSVITNLVLGLFLALLVANHKFLNFFRYIFYVPGVVSAVTMGMLWNQMLDPTKFGMLNSFLMNAFGMEKAVSWLSSPDFTYLVVLGIGLIGCGGGMTLMIFTTAINNISADVKEAAKIEGASAMKMTTQIVLPLIAPIISSWMVLSIIGSLKSFEFIYSLTSGGPNKTTQTLGILLFDGTNTSIYGYGYTSAMGVLMSAVVLLFTGAYMFFTKFNKKSDVEM